MPVLRDAQAIEFFHLALLQVLQGRLDQASYVLKGGANLRYFFDSVRYSEDIDLDTTGIEVWLLEEKVDGTLTSPALTTLLRGGGLAVGEFSKPKQTETTQRWKVPLILAGRAEPLRTKIEFSRRNGEERLILEAVPSRVVAPYALRAPSVRHYLGEAAVEQKIEALAGRSETQARDVFDLELLLRRPADLAIAPTAELREQAAGRQTAPRWQLWTKRGIDILGASLLLLLLSPLLLLTAAAIAFTSRGPIFFSQDRVGYMGQRFRFLKFRSMCHDAEARKEEILHHNHHESGPIFKIRDDPRMTPVGKIIRRFSIDELPQFFHVLQGKMSLVGPRPLPYEDVVQQIPEGHLDDPSMYTTYDLQRLTAVPGITCIWQVSGRSELDYDTWVKMDIEYIENWSLGLDLSLMARTIPAVLSGRGAY